MTFFGLRVRDLMRDFRHPGWWLGVWILGWVLCVALSMIHPPQVDIDIPDGDKIGHFIAYAVLSVWSVLIFAQPRNQWKAALSLIALGIAMEVAQGFLTEDRMMDPKDALADALGVLFGQLLSLSRAQTILQRWDSARIRND